MKVVLVHNERLPVAGYGGTERVVWNLAKGLSEAGISVVLACRRPSECAFAEVVFPDFAFPIETQVPGPALFHFFNTPSYIPSAPYVVTIGGNAKAGEHFLTNTVFVSRNHAERHGATCFVYNGIDPEDYQFSCNKNPSLVFLAKASWRVKNVRGAIRVSRRAGRRLHILGGSRWWLPRWRGVAWEGTVDGRKKAQLLASSSGLLFPVLWHEPFGLAVIEALISGTPVLGTPFGSLPELIKPQVGVICRSEKEIIDAIPRLESFAPTSCREWATENFHYRKMTESYVRLYEQVLSGNPLNKQAPHAQEDQGILLSLPRE